jgi:hypothetical protein
LEEINLVLFLNNRINLKIFKIKKQGLLKKVKSINHKGAQALRNSPVGYFSEGASLQRWHFTSKNTKN